MLKVAMDLEDIQYASWVRKTIQDALGFAAVSFVSAGEDWQQAAQADLFIAGISIAQPERLERLRDLMRDNPRLSVILAGTEPADILDAWQTEFEAYLRGTRNPESLKGAVLRVRDRLDQQEGRCLHMAWKNVSRSIPMNQILYIEKDLRKTNVELATGEVCTSYMKMDDVLAQLDEDFVRIHFSCVVNRRYLKEVRKDSVVLVNGRHLPVSRSYSRNLSGVLGNQA